MYIRIYDKDEKGVLHPSVPLKEVKGKNPSLHAAKIQADRHAKSLGLSPVTRQWGRKLTFIHKPLAWRVYRTEKGATRFIVITGRDDSCYHYWVQSGHADRGEFCSRCLIYKDAYTEQKTERKAFLKKAQQALDFLWGIEFDQEYDDPTDTKEFWEHYNEAFGVMHALLGMYKQDTH
ncbi:MAG: hypothetical protein OXN25_01570 [Candidatus Poribacteria bacterium]|nr:hypothetical protein [Candidatus Poribacteria bacterium]